MLLLKCGLPILLPTNTCIYNTESGMYYTLDMHMNARLAPTLQSSDDDQFHRIYGVRFTRYTAVCSITLNQHVVLMFGNNQSSGELAFLVVRMPRYLMRDASLRGLMLNRNDLLTYGCISELQDVISYEDYTLMLFDKFKEHMKINCHTPDPRTHILDFYNDDDRLFCISYFNTVLHDVKVNELTNKQIYVMKFQ
ncbi:hypothetical protein C1I72_02415 [Ehrlichia canis]|nr:hypothetical protein C1I72_02415 [Ehrlichia canis]